MTTTTIGGLTAAGSLTGTDMIVVELSSGNVTRKMTLTAAAPFFRSIMGVVMAITDNAAFTDGTSTVEPAGFIFDDVAGTALTENDAAAARINANRAIVMVGEDNTTRGQRWAINSSGALSVIPTMSLVDNAAFTDGTSTLVPVGHIFDDVAGTALTENDVATPRIDAKRSVVSVIEDATTRGQRAAVSAGGALSVANVATEVHLGEVGGKLALVAATQFARPADTTAYAVGDIVANSTTAGSVTALSFAVMRVAAGSCQLRRARIRKSTTTTTNAVFRLHLFSSAPTVNTTGDNGTFANVVNTSDSYLGALDVITDRAFATGAAGYGAPTVGNELNIKLASGSTVYGLLEAQGAYAPGNAETFDVAVEVVQN